MLQTSLTLDQLQTYSKCPRQYGYSIGAPKPKDMSTRSIIKDLIKQAYANRSQHGYDPQWETIKSRVDKLVYENVDISNKEAYKLAYKRAMNLLSIMHQWYYKLFSKDDRDGLVNIPLNVLVNKTTITSNIEVAILDKHYQIVPIIFNDQDILPTMLYNNLKFKSLLWLIYKETDIYPKLTYYYQVTDSNISKHEIYNKTPLSTIENYMNFMVRGIENKIFYPSVSEQCNNCEYNSICSI